jgi:hypothetical protein
MVRPLDHSLKSDRKNMRILRIHLPILPRLSGLSLLSCKSNFYCGARTISLPGHDDAEGFSTGWTILWLPK